MGALSVWKSAQKSKWPLFSLLKSKIRGRERPVFLDEYRTQPDSEPGMHLSHPLSKGQSQLTFQFFTLKLMGKVDVLMCFWRDAWPFLQVLHPPRLYSELLLTGDDFDADHSGSSASPGRWKWWCRQDAYTHESKHVLLPALALLNRPFPESRGGRPGESPVSRAAASL